ncbi:mitochondrial inner membrane protein Mitofilin [Cyathus striatus]|nr:mitochondrial inner membrane protein Mitofilin [Cyathus striatus]
MLEYAEAHGWDKVTTEDVTNAVVTARRFITDTINRSPGAVEGAKHALEKKIEAANATASKILHNTNEEVKPVVDNVKSEIIEEAKKAQAVVNQQAEHVSEELTNLVHKAEEALTGKPFPTDETATAQPDVIPPEPESVPSSDVAVSKDIYTAPLPLGFEPPPGFSRPAPKKEVVPVETTSPVPVAAPLPLVAPAVSSVGATDILETAKGDLTALAERIEKAKEDERVALEAKLDEQTREYTLKLIELEMEAQDKLDSQGEGFKKFFESERGKIIQAYREKLDHELRTQTELINERLKEEVIAQGIELQRRWIREIKVRVEEERGGRLAKLDELSASLKKLERIALDNSSYLDENIRVHALWSALPTILRHIAAAQGSDIPDVGVEPFADLVSWFTSEVAPKVSQVALVPDENAGVLSYLASRALSGLRFKRHGLVSGNDVLSVLSRAGHYLNEKDLDGAARELNQLKGPAKLLIHDWLEAARRRLEVQQALDVAQTQATLASLLVV